MHGNRYSDGERIRQQVNKEIALNGSENHKPWHIAPFAIAAGLAFCKPCCPMRLCAGSSHV